MEVADAGQVMPPKSTWFDPKTQGRNLFFVTAESKKQTHRFALPVMKILSFTSDRCVNLGRRLMDLCRETRT